LREFVLSSNPLILKKWYAVLNLKIALVLNVVYNENEGGER